jgi:hypothetical protein
MKLSPKPPALDLTVKYAQLFHHNDFGWILAENQLKPEWKTISTHQLSLGELIRLFLEEQALIGVGFGQTTKYGTIDIDWSSKYHPAHDIDKYREILNILESIGLTRYLPLQSSWSRGIHIYFPLPEAVGTFELAAAMRVVLTDAGIEVKNGQLEIFPNTKQFAKTPGEYSHYKPHRTPLQPDSGSYLLEDDGLEPQPIPDTTEAQLTAFLDQWNMAAAGQDMALLRRKLPQLYTKYKQQKNRFKYQSSEDKSKKAREWETALDLTIKIGWTGTGQTYSLLPKFLAYGVVFLKLTGKELHEWMHKAITTAPGYQQYCQHQHEIGKIISAWIKTNDRTQYYSPYRSEPDRSQRYPFGDPTLIEKPQPQENPANKKTADLALHRLKTAYACLIHKLTPETKISELREMIRAQMKKIFNLACSNSTLNKYKHIWHPDRNGKNLTTLSHLKEKAPEDRQIEEISSCIDVSENESFETQTVSQSESAHPQTSMICSALEIQPNLNTPTHPRNSYYSILTTDNVTNAPQNPGKFEVLAGVLSKIIGVAAIVVNVGLAAGIGGEIVSPEPAIAVEINSISTPTQPHTHKQVETERETTDPTDLDPLPPCRDPRIPSMYLIEYNPNQIGVPWTTAEEFYKFLGYLVIVAKQDKTIKNSWAWAITSIKNLKERGINSHWLNFTGQEMLDPNSPIAEYLRQRFSPTPTAPANVTINRPSEPISKIVQRVNNQPTNREPMEIPPATTQIATSRHQHSPDISCPKCQIFTPAVELERWEMCRFCATKIMFKRKI